MYSILRNKHLYLLAVGFAAVIFSSFVTISTEVETAVFKDDRDGKEYKIVKIGKQWWFAENFNYETEGSWCEKCETYGRMYNFETALKACPKGWHLPTVAEWEMLISELGGSDVAASKMKMEGKWGTVNQTCNNSSGFSAVPAPTRGTRGNIREPYEAVFWSADKIEDPASWTYVVSANNSKLSQMGYYRVSGFSVRYVKD